MAESDFHALKEEDWKFKVLVGSDSKTHHKIAVVSHRLQQQQQQHNVNTRTQAKPLRLWQAELTFIHFFRYPK